MRRIPVRLGVLAFLICLPTVALTAAGVYFCWARLPTLERTQRRLATSAYRDVAENLVRHPSSGTFAIATRPKGWRQVSRLPSGMPWGYVNDLDVSEHADECLVWIERRNKTLIGVWTPRQNALAATWLVKGGVPLTLLALWALTLVCLRYLLLYARVRDDFLAAAAHDLTTPLVGMRLVVGKNDEAARMLVERMLIVVNNLKEFLARGARRAKPKCEPLDLLALCHEAYDIFRDDYQDVLNGCDVSITSDGMVRAVGDDTRVLQILWNLFGNDLKYAAPYGLVRVHVSQDASTCRVAFIDEGPGMTPRQRRRAFDRYYRAATARQDGKGGFGIGLCTAREFAREMGGDLTITAHEPKGCVFTLVLPAC